MEKVISVNPEQLLSESGSRQSRSRADGAAKNKGQVLGSTKISICLTKLFFVEPCKWFIVRSLSLTNREANREASPAAERMNFQETCNICPSQSVVGQISERSNETERKESVVSLAGRNSPT